MPHQEATLTHCDMADDDIIEFIGIYDADATLWGEVSYWVGARLGRRHCSLCDITHGLFTRRKEWTTCAEELPVAFVTFHRNDAPDDAKHAAAGRFPCVLQRTSDGVRMALDPQTIAACQGEPQRLLDALINQLETPEMDS
jgi:hypothetical protein